MLEKYLKIVGPSDRILASNKAKLLNIPLLKNNLQFCIRYKRYKGTN